MGDTCIENQHLNRLKFVKYTEIRKSIRILEILFKAYLLPSQDERESIHFLGNDVKKMQKSSMYPAFSIRTVPLGSQITDEKSISSWLANENERTERSR